jgi:GT2 family glycosyltransferase
LSNKPRRRAPQRTAQPKAKTPGSSGAGGVVTAVVHGHQTGSPRFWNSYIDLLLMDAHRYGHICGRIDETAGANIVTPRNKVLREFVEQKPDAEWVLLLDDDMTFEPDLLDRLLASADKTERPIVGGLCFSLNKGEDQEVCPTLYGLGPQGTTRMMDYPPDQLVQVAATGAACLLIHRTALEAVAAKFPKPWPWFQETITGDDWGDSMSEDITFCLRANSVGLPVHVDTAVKVGHVKPVVVDEAMFLANRPRVAPQPEPPAPTYVVIPVKGKHGYTADLLRQIGEQGGVADVFVYDNGSDSDPWDPADFADRVACEHSIIPAAGKNIHEMWNAGIKRAIAENPRCNIAILNNDLEIGPEFLSRLSAGLRSRFDVVAVCGNYDGRQFPEQLQAVKGVAAGRMDGTGGLAGFAFMVKGEIFAAGCPMFDEDYEIWYGDTDFTRMLDAGGGVYGIVRDATVVHIDGGSKTAGDGAGKRLTPELAEAAERDRVRFEKKWGAA